MTHTADLSTEPASYTQRFAIEFEYPVYFTHGLFTPGNPILADTVARLEPAKRHRVVTFIDDAVASAIPTLSSDIASYAARHEARLELLASPEIVPGGEQTKNSLELVEHLRHRLSQLGVDRHSCIIVIGGENRLDVFCWLI